VKLQLPIEYDYGYTQPDLYGDLRFTSDYVNPKWHGKFTYVALLYYNIDSAVPSCRYLPAAAYPSIQIKPSAGNVRRVQYIFNVSVDADPDAYK